MAIPNVSFPFHLINILIGNHYLQALHYMHPYLAAAGHNDYTKSLALFIPLIVQITFIFIDFRVCDFAFAFKTQNALRVLDVFYFQTDLNLRFKRKRDVRLTCKRV